MAIATAVRKIDGDTHFNHAIDQNELKDLLTRAQMYESRDILRRTTTVRSSRPQSKKSEKPDPENEAEVRLAEMDRLGFDTQVLMTQDAMPSPLLPALDKPVWLRAALAVLYNNEAARIQNRYAGRYIPMATVAWDDIDASVRELERVKDLGLKAVQIKGSWMDRSFDDPGLYPFWEAVNALDLTCLVHNTTQGCNATIADHDTSYPMVGHERYHRLHIGTYLGFGIDYQVAATALSLGGVLEEFPNLRFVFYEAGATWMTYAMLGADRAFYIEPNCARSKRRPSELIKQHCWTAVENLEPLEDLVSAYGSENFIIGTDFPHPEFQFLPNATTDITDKPRLTDADKTNVLGANLARALKL
jgi:aminocarboxymuconate-semialdehyde decarboxylase